jgi:hypothetical protein
MRSRIIAIGITVAAFFLVHAQLMDSSPFFVGYPETETDFWFLFAEFITGISGTCILLLDRKKRRRTFFLGER